MAARQGKRILNIDFPSFRANPSEAIQLVFREVATCLAQLLCTALHCDSLHCQAVAAAAQGFSANANLISLCVWGLGA